MAFKDLTDPKAVLKAISECDDLGRDKFLKKYGFQQARNYLLIYKSKQYDSKAIVGAAHGFQFGKLSLLMISQVVKILYNQNLKV